jgi:hypothetical protein
MKTLVHYTIALVLLATVLNANATNPHINFMILPEESYIDDIPFSTENIYDSVFDATLVQSYDLNEEDYIEDIPFSTEEVVNNAVDFQLEEETYIDDIPFSTSDMVNQH